MRLKQIKIVYEINVIFNRFCKKRSLLQKALNYTSRVFSDDKAVDIKEVCSFLESAYLYYQAKETCETIENTNKHKTGWFCSDDPDRIAAG